MRFNAGIRSYLFRSAISVSVLPLQNLNLTLKNGKTFAILRYFTTGHLRSTSGTMRRMEIENDDEPLIHHPVSPDEVQRAHNE